MRIVFYTQYQINTLPSQHIVSYKATLSILVKKPQIFAEQLDRILSNKMKYCLRYGFPCELRQNSVISLMQILKEVLDTSSIHIVEASCFMPRFSCSADTRTVGAVLNFSCKSGSVRSSTSKNYKQKLSFGRKWSKTELSISIICDRFALSRISQPIDCAGHGLVDLTSIN